MTTDQTRALIAADRLDEAIALLTRLIAAAEAGAADTATEAAGIADDNKNADSAADGLALAELYRLRGDAHRRLGRIPAAITDYEHALALNPASPAVAALEVCNDILNFYNPDLLNP